MTYSENSCPISQFAVAPDLGYNAALPYRRFPKLVRNQLFRIANRRQTGCVANVPGGSRVMGMALRRIWEAWEVLFRGIAAFSVRIKCAGKFYG